MESSLISNMAPFFMLLHCVAHRIDLGMKILCTLSLVDNI
jgi:hypothetical protein